MSTHFTTAALAATFRAEKATKADLFRGRRLFLGLNCFEPGQSQPLHTHAGADKFYFVLSGKARMRVGDEARTVVAGMVVWAPEDVPHGVEEALEQTVMLVGIGPPPETPGTGG